MATMKALVALLGGLISSLAQGSDTQAVLKAGDPVPGSPGTFVTSIAGVSVNDAGQWIALVGVTGLTQAAVTSTMEIARIGTSVPTTTSGTATISQFRSFRLLNNGGALWMFDLITTSGATTNRGIYLQPNLTSTVLTAVLNQNDVTLFAPPQTYSDLGTAMAANEAGQFFISPELSGSPGTKIGPVLVTTMGGVVVNDSHVVPAMAPPWTFGTLSDRNAGLNGSGVEIYSYSVTGAVNGIASAGASVAEVPNMLPAGLGTGTWNILGGRAAAINDAGDLAVVAQVLPGPREILARSIGGAWQLIAAEGAALPATCQNLNASSIGVRVFLASNSDLIWLGTSGTPPVPALYVNDDQVLLQKGDLLPLGAGTATVNGFTITTDDDVDVSDSGAFVAVRASLLTPSVTDALLLVDRRYPVFCSGDALCSCPCGNAGVGSSGCDIPQATGGVKLSVLSQTTSPNSATLVGTAFPSGATPSALIMRSSSLDPSSPVVFGDGLRCIEATSVVRLAATLASGGQSQHVIGHSAMAGPGTFYYQIWFRSTPSTFCDPLAAFNMSNGRALVW